MTDVEGKAEFYVGSDAEVDISVMSKFAPTVWAFKRYL